MLYIRVSSRSQSSHPHSALLKAGLPFPCEVRNQTIKYLRDLATAVQGVSAKAVSSHSEHWCWPTSLRAQLISCSAHLSWPVFVALVRHKVQMEGCPLVLVGSWAVCCKPGAFSNRI